MQNVEQKTDVLTQDQGFGVSSRYKVVTTQKLISTLESKGYQVNSVQAAAVRSPQREGYQRHFVRLSRPDFGTWDVLGSDVRPEITIVNAYDGTTSLRMGLGAFRFVCLNGLILGNAYGFERINHVGDILQQIPSALESLVERFQYMNERIQTFVGTSLTVEQRMHFAANVAQYLVRKRANLVSTRYNTLLQVRRDADRATDLWTTLNVIQENALQGNLDFIVRTDKGLERRKLRRIGSIDRNIKVNQFIWDAADRVAI